MYTIALVRAVMNCSTDRGSMFSVSGNMSANMGVAPRNTNALAVETNVKLGTMIASPEDRSNRSAASSRAAVHDVVRRPFLVPIHDSNIASQRLVQWPPTD